MPFNAVTGAWESGGDHAWTMPSTSAGDIIGGFNSAEAFRQNQERERLSNLLSELVLRQGEFRFGEEQAQSRREDDFRAGLQPRVAAGSGMEMAPELDSPEKIDAAMMGLDPKSSFNVMSRRDTAASNLRYRQAGLRLSEYGKAVRAGQDSELLSQKMLEEFPDMPQLAQSLRGMKIDPKTAGVIDLNTARASNIDADTALKNQKYALLEQLNPKTVEGRQAMNELIRAKVSLEQMRVKGGGATPADRRFAATQLWRAVSYLTKMNDIRSGALVEDDNTKKILVDIATTMLNDNKNILSSEGESVVATTNNPAPKKKSSKPVLVYDPENDDVK